MNRLLVLALLAAAPGLVRGAATIEGIPVNAEASVAGAPLMLNGAGLRTFNLGPFPVKIYVASFYAPCPLRSMAEVLKTRGPLQFNFTFLRSVGQAQVREAWNAQFAASASHDYATLAEDQARFVSFFGPLKAGSTKTINLVGEETQVYQDGAWKGTISGREFQKAFLSMWFGAKPVTPSLKADLLGLR